MLFTFRVFGDVVEKSKAILITKPLYVVCFFFPETTEAFNLFVSKIQKSIIIKV